MRMTDEQEYACRSRPKWKRDGADWVLHCGRRRMGRVVPDDKYPGMFRSVKSRGLSDMANLSWSKDAVMAEAIRDLEWDLRQDGAIDPSKCPVNEGVNHTPPPPMRSFARPVICGASGLESRV
jgi:hypothetical protein